MFEQIIRGLNGGGEWFCGWAWAMLWQSSIVIAALFALDLALRKRVRATVRYALWMLVLVKLVLPPSLCVPTGVGYWCNVNLPAETAVQEIRNPNFETRNNFQIANVGNAQNEESTQRPLAAEVTRAASVPSAQVQPAVAVTWQGMAFLAWLAGVLVLVLLVLQRVAFVRGLIAQSKPAEGRLREMMEECRAQAGVRGNVELRLTENMLSPAACGLWRPVVLMPRPLLENLSRERVRAVLIHELVHVRRMDLWVNLVQTVLQIAYFYNPLLWAANARIRAAREQAVDEAALANLGDEAGEYGKTLVAVAEIAFRQPHLSLRLVGVVESKKSLASRIRHIAQMGVPKSAKIGLGGVTAVILAAFVLLPMASAKSSPAEFVVKGKVADAATGKPIAGARVGDDGYAGGKQWTTSDANGDYSYLTWYEEHNIMCSAPGHTSKKETLLTKVFGSEKERVLNFDMVADNTVPKSGATGVGMRTGIPNATFAAVRSSNRSTVLGYSIRSISEGAVGSQLNWEVLPNTQECRIWYGWFTIENGQVTDSRGDILPAGRALLECTPKVGPQKIEFALGWTTFDLGQPTTRAQTFPSIDIRHGEVASVMSGFDEEALRFSFGPQVLWRGQVGRQGQPVREDVVLVVWPIGPEDKTPVIPPDHFNPQILTISPKQAGGDAAKDASEPVRLGKWEVDMPGHGPLRLVAVFKPNEKPWKFWDPDGNPLPDFKADKIILDKPSEHTLAVVFQRSWRAPNDSHDTNGNIYLVQSWYKEADIREPVAVYGTGYGDWEDCGRLELYEGFRYDDDDYVLSHVQQEKDGLSVKMNFTYNRAKTVRLVIVQKDGTETFVEGVQDLTGKPADSGQWMLASKHYLLKKSEIAYLKLQRRPLAWAKFRGFALEPNEPNQPASVVGAWSEAAGDSGKSAKGEITIDTTLFLVDVNDRSTDDVLKEALEADGVTTQGPLFTQVELTEDQAMEFIKRMNATPGAKTFAAPKVKVRDGEKAEISVSKTEPAGMGATAAQGEFVTTGLWLGLTPSLQKDGSTILLEVMVQMADRIRKKDETGKEFKMPEVATESMKTMVRVPTGKRILVPLGGIAERQIILLVKASVD